MNSLPTGWRKQLSAREFPIGQKSFHPFLLALTQTEILEASAADVWLKMAAPVIVATLKTVF
jgi:hypothetical protein